MTQPNTFWPESHTDALRSMVPSAGLSFAEIAAALNSKFCSSYSRNAVIGKATRMGLSNPLPEGWTRTPAGRSGDRTRERHKRLTDARREERWARNPYLKELAERRKQGNKPALQIILSNGATKTSPAYRRHLPHIGEMSKTQLRAMLTTAVQNTAGMEV